MPRYEEMDDLLRRVRERLVDGLPERAVVDAKPQSSPPVFSLEGQYECALECMQALLRTAEALREHVGAECAQTFTQEQHEHLLSLLSAVMRELWSSEVALQRVGPFD